MDDPSPVDPEVLRRMRKFAVVSIAQRSKAWMEAATEVRGLCRGIQPALPETTIDEAEAGVLRDLDLALPRAKVVSVGGSRLKVAEPVEAANSLAYVMRFNERGISHWAFIRR